MAPLALVVQTTMVMVAQGQSDGTAGTVAVLSGRNDGGATRESADRHGPLIHPDFPSITPSPFLVTHHSLGVPHLNEHGKPYKNGWVVLGGLTIGFALYGAFQAAVLEDLAGSPRSSLESAAILGAAGAAVGLVYCVVAKCDWCAPFGLRNGTPVTIPSRSGALVTLATWHFGRQPAN